MPIVVDNAKGVLKIVSYFDVTCVVQVKRNGDDFMFVIRVYFSIF